MKRKVGNIFGHSKRGEERRGEMRREVNDQTREHPNTLGRPVSDQIIKRRTQSKNERIVDGNQVV